MSTRGARSLGADVQRDEGRTPAQWYCLLAGLALLLGGIFGFIADASFDTSTTSDSDTAGNADGALQGDGFLGFEVNGWHNVVHIVSGVVLLAAFRRRDLAKTIALAFGLIYGVVTVIGLIDGNDILGFIPVNAADNILHLALSALGILTGLSSRGTDRIDDDRGERSPTRRTVERRGHHEDDIDAPTATRHASH